MGRRFPWEEEFMKKLQELQDPVFGFSRKISGTCVYCNLIGHPDDLQVTLPPSTVSIVEHKTTKTKSPSSIGRYKRPMSTFQAQIYAFILEPIIRELEGSISRYHAVCYWHSQTFQPIKYFIIEYYPKMAKHEIVQILTNLKENRIIAPKSWKCRFCSQEHKEVCQFWRERSKPEKT